MARRQPRLGFIQLAGLGHGLPWYRDPMFGLFLVAGGVCWLLLWLNVPLQPMSGRQLTSWRFISLAFIQPCIEEVVFRGILQGVLLTWNWGRHTWHGLTVANGLTAGVFTLVHLWHHPPLWALAVLAPALAFGICRDRYHNVYPAIILHVFYNTGYFVLTGLPG